MVKNPLASQRCMEILRALEGGALPLSELAERIKQETSNTSNYIASLRDNDLVKKLEDGRWGITRSGQYVIKILK